MTSRIRLLLAWLLLALLPVQGVAAAAMSGCPGHQGTGHAVAATEGVGHDAMDDAAHGHCDRQQDRTQQKHPAGCDTCGSCCLAGALALPAAAVDPSQPVAWSPIAFHPPFAPAVISARLERPPR